MKWYAAAVVSFLIFSCSETPEIPSNILQPKQLQEVIWDMVRADAYAEILRQKDTVNTPSKINMHLTDTIFALHHTNRAQVENSLKFYSAHPDILKPIMDSLGAQQTRKTLPEPVKVDTPVKTQPAPVKIEKPVKKILPK